MPAGSSGGRGPAGGGIRHLAAFRLAFDAAVRAAASPEDFEPVLLSDGELPPECFSETFVEMLREAGPWGQGFPEPLFHGDFLCLEQRLLKEKHLKLRLATGSGTFDAMHFFCAEALPDTIRAVYSLSVNEYNGNESLQLIVRHWS